MLLSLALRAGNGLRRVRIAVAEFVARRWKTAFYLYLAAAISVAAVLDTTTFQVTARMRQSAYDAMVRHRLVKPKADPDIVVVDINEASLSAMAKEFGIWPWPRSVLGEFVDGLEKQRPKAIVFDILFSDADVYRPESDASFEQTIAGTNNTFFPMLRLDPASDALSDIRASMIPGAVTPTDHRPGVDPLGPKIAMVLPHFQAAIGGGA